MNYLSHNVDFKVSQAVEELAKSYNIVLSKDESIDSYSEIAASLFGVPYSDCCEFKNGKPYAIGKYRRQLVKFAVLGYIATTDYTERLIDAENKVQDLRFVEELSNKVKI